MTLSLIDFAIIGLLVLILGVVLNWLMPGVKQQDLQHLNERLEKLEKKLESENDQIENLRSGLRTFAKNLFTSISKINTSINEIHQSTEITESAQLRQEQQLFEQQTKYNAKLIKKDNEVSELRHKLTEASGKANLVSQREGELARKNEQLRLYKTVFSMLRDQGIDTDHLLKVARSKSKTS